MKAPSITSTLKLSLVSLIACLLVCDVTTAEEKKEKEVLKPSDKANPYSELRSGLDFLPKEIGQIQKESFTNPGILLSKQGETLWTSKQGKAQKSCAFCHNEALTAMSGVAARYPAYSKDKKRPITIEQRINLCREKHLKVPAYKSEAEELITLSAYVSSFSKGRPSTVKTDGKMKPYFEAGRKEYYSRRGQLNISCAQCHEDNVGKKFRGLTLSQGQNNGYPAYSIKAERLRLLHQRFQACNALVRAQSSPIGSEAYVNLELYLSWRGKDLKRETPAVRY